MEGVTGRFLRMDQCGVESKDVTGEDGFREVVIFVMIVLLSVFILVFRILSLVFLPILSSHASHMTLYCLVCFPLQPSTTSLSSHNIFHTSFISHAASP